LTAWLWVAIVIAVIVVVIALCVFLLSRRKRATEVKERFGPEYERAVAETGSNSQAVSQLEERQKRREVLDIRPLEPSAVDRYRTSWRQTQTRFVDYPGDAIRDADSLVAEVMRERGYPVEDFEQRAQDLSVDHPEVVQNYRAAHAISLANEHGEATTEDLRQAMVHYRSLFDELLESKQT
jgi:hypothetical protein